MSVAVDAPDRTLVAHGLVPWRRSLAALIRRGLLDHRRGPLTWGARWG